MASLSDLIGSAKLSTMMAGAGSGVLSSIAQGDIGGAIKNIADIPGDSLSAFAASGGVTPGDALAGINAREDALQDWCWYCLPPPIDTANSITLAGMSGQTSLPWYYVQKANLPWRNIQMDTTTRNGRATYYPQSYSLPDINLELFLDNSNKAMTWAKNWQGQVLANKNPSQPNNQGGWGLPAKYKKTLQFVLLSTKRKQLMNIKYINCTPSDLSPFEVVSTASGALALSMTIKVEDVDVTLSNDKGLIDSLSSMAGGYAMSAISNIASPFLNNLGDIASQIVIP